jgi:hypothetical protein
MVQKFQHQLARLVSLLHATALQSLSPKSNHKFEILDLNGFEKESILFLENSPDRVEIVMQWVQKLVVDADTDKALKIAPPILSRVYNQLGNGVVDLNQCRTINDIPIPFPFVQSLTVMLLVQTLITPLICAASTGSALWASVDCFIVVTCFWTLNYIAMELEFPFGTDGNDAPLEDMQIDINKSLTVLLQKRALKPPTFDFDAVSHNKVYVRQVNLGNMCEEIFATEKLTQIAEKSCNGELDGTIMGSIRSIKIDLSTSSLMHTAQALADRAGRAVQIGVDARRDPFDTPATVGRTAQSSAEADRTQGFPGTKALHVSIPDSRWRQDKDQSISQEISSGVEIGVLVEGQGASVSTINKNGDLLNS